MIVFSVLLLQLASSVAVDTSSERINYAIQTVLKDFIQTHKLNVANFAPMIVILVVIPISVSLVTQ